jgi:UDPglucose 6-dehydrogenase
VRQGIGADPRIGYHFIYPGAGYGGSCFPKDVQALARTAHAAGYDARLLGAVEIVNDTQKSRLFELLSGHFGGELKGLTVAVWGLAFKPNTDDMREAPSRRLMERLWEAGAKVRAFDPEAAGEARRLYGERDDLQLVERPYQALEGADALVIVTEWKAFRSPDFTRVKSLLSTPVIFDGRNLYDPATVEEAGIAYYGIGRGRSLKGREHG